ncbi:glycosyltransferase family 39 protein [Candidatus Gottesmanbacteria bacterium]|nr:glycosyltransferase family 39 protein [Candidatus Gottesmanbacteria bacterium]
MKKIRYLFISLVIMSLPFRLYHLNYPLLDATNFRQTQTATIALNFYKYGINLFGSQLDIFGIGKEKYLTLEFPLYEAVVASLYKIGFSEVWGRVVSIIAGFVGAYFLFKLTLLILDTWKVAYFSAFFFLFAPLNMFYERTFMIEPTLIACLLAGLYYFCLWNEKQNKIHLVFSIIFLTFGFIQKALYGPFWLLPILAYFIRKKTSRFHKFFKFILFAAIPLIILIVWQEYANYINTQNGHEYFTSGNIKQLIWNFGLLEDRFSFSMWQPRLQQLVDGIFLKPGLIIFLLGLVSGLYLKNTRFFYAWIASQILYFLIVFRIQSHNYYQMIMIPAASVFMSIGLIKLSDWISLGLRELKFNHINTKHTKTVFLTLFCAFFILRSWMHTRWDFYLDWKWYNRLLLVGKSVHPNKYGILINPGYDWNSSYTYYPRLKALLVSVEDVSPASIGKLQQTGYSYLILHDDTQYPGYLKGINREVSLDFLQKYKQVLNLEDFKVYLFK